MSDTWVRKVEMPFKASQPIPDRKEMLIKFMRESKFNTDYELELPNVKPEAAAIFIQGMRVHLSKLKKDFRKRGRVLKAFKMLHIGTRQTDNGCVIVLQKATTSRTMISDAVNEAFSDLVMDFNAPPEGEGSNNG